MPDFRTADIVFTRESAWYSRLIRWGTRYSGEAPSRTSHVGIGLDGVCFAEALAHAVVTEWSVLAHRDPSTFEVWRYDYLTISQIKDIKNTTIDYLGRSYGYGKIALQGLDCALGKIFATDVYCFRRLAFMHKYPICSWLVAHAYDSVGYRFNINPDAADPDEIYDHVSSTKGWRKIL
jgi:hypothetical protein